LATQSAKIQQTVTTIQQGAALVSGTLERIQQWGQKNRIAGGESVVGESALQSTLMDLLGLSPKGLQFTLHSAGLSPTTFEVLSFDLTDRYSTVFVLNAEVTSHDSAVPFNAVLDNQATFGIWQDGTLVREIRGVVAQFEQGDSGFHQTVYRLQLMPELWRLSLRNNSRIFQHKDIQSILTALLTDNQVTDYRFMLRHPHPEREFCVQYRETDLAFFERLAAEEGIYYYFDKQSVLVLSDDAETLNHAEAVVLDYNPHKNAQLQARIVTGFRHHERVRVSHTVLMDYTFKKPIWGASFQAEGKDLEHQRPSYEHYDFPGRFKDKRGEQYSRYRLESLRRDAHSGSGESNSPELSAGGVLQLQSHPNSRFNTLWQCTAVRYYGKQPQGAKQEAGEGATTLSGEFEVIPRHQTWRPLQRTKPLVEGPQMAIVTGPKGEEIYTDNFGRIRVQFLWDREGRFDDHSSCWIRVTQPWSGKGWGMVAIPRVGHEVVVDFLEGDPDQPIVTGRTYHANMPLPAKLPQNKTQMHLMSQTYKGGGYNGMMMEDEKGRQRLDFHAQHDMNTVVLNDRSTNVGGNHSETVLGEQKIGVSQSRYKEVVGDESVTIGASQVISVGKDYQLTVNADMLMKSNVDNILLETAGARLTLFKDGNIQLEAKDVVILGNKLQLNPGGSAVSSGAAGMAGAGGSDEGSFMPPVGAIMSGVEEFGKRGEKLKKSTTPLKSSGEFKYYNNGWNGNQHIKTENVFNKNATKVAKRVGIAGGLLDIYEVITGFNQDMKEYDKNRKEGKFIARNTVKESAGVVGGLAGAAVGAKIFGGMGGAVGGPWGGLGGAVFGAVAGAWLGEDVVEDLAQDIIEFFE
ncbi:type VI secretion system tip protein VgrG, partial [Glaesserella sp.]|uniref:type VI secretion system Vgr family protein n=1 Tax=Glaesserella sp. TaxID=2094731 RepID=UPI00359FD268